MKILVTTVEKCADAKKLAHLLVEKKLAACATYHPAKSIYCWKGKLADSREYVVEFKCADGKLADAKKLILSKHQYSLPMLYSISPSWADANYSKWLKSL